MQTAGKGSAYIIKDKAGMRMIQSEEFSKAYVVTNGQQANVRNNQSRDL